MKQVTKNYFDPDSEKFIIGGELLVKADASLTVEDGGTITGIAGFAGAAGSALGGVKAAAKGAGDTVEVKIDGPSSKLYVPTYPVVPAAANQLDSTAEDATALVSDFNALLAKLKAAGLMAGDA